MYHWLFVVFAVPGGRMRLVERRKGDGSAAVSGGAAADQFSVCTATLAHISTASTTQHLPLYQTLSRSFFIRKVRTARQAGSRVVTKFDLLQTVQTGRGSELEHFWAACGLGPGQ